VSLLPPERAPRGIKPAAGALGMHRALFYHEQEEHVETFRPYALPGNDWLEDVAQKLARPWV
jgi:S-DNA-T family DNA segregation ATPase FtsK/SpoIIIE